MTFRENPVLGRLDICVDVTFGKVYLSGRVTTRFERQQAELTAQGVKGVTRIINNLSFDNIWVWKPDWEIGEDITDQLLWSPFVDENNVSVTVLNGVVTLTGTVETLSERLDAEKNAYEGGAKSVINNLTVTHRFYGPFNNSLEKGIRPW